MPASDAGPPGSPGAGARAAPPFRIPGQHFAAALAFLVLGAAGLAWRAPALAAGAFSDPGVLAATHLLTLGWISTSIMGALYQFLPVALGAAVRWERLADATFLAWSGGVALFAAGLGAGVAGLRLAGALLLGVGVLLFTTNLAATLERAERRGITWWCVAGAGLSLLGGWVLGLLLALNLSTGLLGAGRFAVLAIHLHVAAGGWVLLTMIGVGHHLLPMFLLSHGASDRPEKVAASLVAVGTAGLLMSGHLLPVDALRPALWLMAAGAAAFLLQGLLRFRHRRRLDPGTRLVAGAMLLLALAVAAGTAALASSPGPRLLTAYGVLLVPGGLGLFVAGHYYRIVPFLTWFHRFGPVAAEREVPRVGELFDHRVAHVAAALLVAGVVALAAGVLAGSPAVCLAGSLAFGVGAVTQSAQMVGVSRSRPAPAAPEAAAPEAAATVTGGEP